MIFKIMPVFCSETMYTKGYIIDYTLFNMCDVHVQVFLHTNIYHSQCFDLFFASSVFVPDIKN